jgi:hypothetical protein
VTRPFRAAILAGLLAGLFLCVQPALAQAEVQIELADDGVTSGVGSFGVGGIHRPGDDVGIRVTVRAAEGGFGAATNVLLQWEMPNADGDIAEVRRVIALTQGGSTTTWLYGTLPPDLSPEQTWTIRAFLYDDEAGGARGAEIGTTIIQAPSGGRLSPGMSVIGRVGTGNNMGLDGYRIPTMTGNRGGEVITAHEDTIVRPLTVAQLPDAWPGLMPFDVLVWSVADPGLLTARQEAAIRDWIAGGGHLVVVLSETGNPWRIGDPGAGPLSDLLPPREPERREDVPLARLIPTLTKSRELARPPINDGFEIRVFDDLLDDTVDLDPGWEPLVTTEAGEVIAIRRAVGHGHLSIVGLPLGDDPRFTGVRLGHGLVTNGWLPQADAFWNRVLGRRAATPTVGELEAMPSAEVARGAPDRRLIDGGVIANTITMSEEAGAGLLLALVLFIGYWLLAGPIGFAVLKARGQVRHAWVAFVVSAAVFTGLAWVGVTALRKRDLDVRHFTVLDWVADDGSGLPGPPQMARATSWMSLYLPSYGSAEVGLGDGVPAGGRSRLGSWVPSGPARPQAFPNADRYAVDGTGRGAAPMDLPARATVTQLRADWRGALEGDWSGVLREDPDDPVRVVIGADGEEELAGSLINRLPASLRDVLVIWVGSDRLTRVRYGLDEDGDETVMLPLTDPDRMVNEVRMWSYNPVFDPGMRIPLQPDRATGNAGLGGAARASTSRFSAAVDEWMKSFESDGSAFGVGRDVISGRESPRRLMNMASVFEQLPAPVWRADSNGRRADTVRLTRLLGRHLDLSPWFARPCVIVIGYVEGVSTPLPLTVEGRPLGGSGTVMMRWIMPLKTNVERAFETELAAAREVAEAARRAADGGDDAGARGDQDDRDTQDDTEAGSPAGES